MAQYPAKIKYFRTERGARAALAVLRDHRALPPLWRIRGYLIGSGPQMRFAVQCGHRFYRENGMIL